MRKHAKRCHMSWVLERDREREGVWLEPMTTAADPQLFGAAAAQPAKKHGPRGAATSHAVQPVRRSCAAVPWTLLDKRKLVERERKQLWPLPRSEWLSLAVLDSSGWLAQAALSADEGGAGAPPAKRARGLAYDAADGEERLALRAHHGSDGTGSQSEAEVWADRSHGADGAALRERLARMRDGEGRFDGRRASALGDSTPDLPSPGDESAEPSPPGSWYAPAARSPLPSRPAYPVPGSRAQPPGLWPDLRPLPRLAGVPRPMATRPTSHPAHRAAKMNLHEMLAAPALRQLYFAAAGYAVPLPLQLSREVQPLHTRPDQFVRMVYWRRAGDAPAAPAAAPAAPAAPR